jgi:uncharacterized membrane protein YbhN (UPF0104 family)
VSTGLSPRPRAVLGLSALIAGATVAAIAISDSPRALWHTVTHSEPGWLGVALAAKLLAYAGYVFTYRESIFAEERSRPSLGHVARLVVAGFGPSVAAGGFAFDRRALTALHFSHRGAKIRVLGLGVIEYLLLAPAATACALLLFLDSRASPLLTLPWIIGVPTGFALAWMVTHPRIVGRFEHPTPGVRRAVADALAGIEVLRKIARQPSSYLGAVLGMAIYWSAEIACLGFALRCFGVAIFVPSLVLAYATGYAASRRSLPFGGAGLTESLLTVSLIAVHVHPARALISVLAYRVINFLLPMLFGLLAHSSVAQMIERRATPGAAG